MAVNNRGWLDTNARIGDILQADEYLTHLVFRHLNIDDLTEANTDTIIAATTIFCHARYPAYGKPLRSKEYVESLVIGELMAPVMPTTMSLGQGAAREEFLLVMRYLIDNPTMHTRNRGHAEWVAEVIAAHEELQEVDPIQVPDRADMNIGDYAAYLVWLAIRLAPNMYMSPMRLVVSTYVGVAKRGTLSDKYVTKVVNGVRDDLGINLELEFDTIKMAYVNFGRHITANNAQEVFTRWLTSIPEHALRLRLCLEQVSGSGLTAYVIVGRAMRRFHDFPWDRLDVVTGGEVTRYMAAMRTVNGNAYYGFNRDLGPAKSTLFSSVAFVAKELLIKIAGESSLTKYQGWIKRPKNPAAVDTLISEYVTRAEARLIEVANAPADPAALDTIVRAANNDVHNDMFA